MPLSLDMRKIVKVEVVPWEIDEGLYGVAYTTNEGWEGLRPDWHEGRSRGGRPRDTNQKIVAFDRALNRTDG